jgi:predicted aldo/keto reductase-like oxidoreductase
MQYRINNKNGQQVSALAFGCMRFHKSDEEVERQILRAVELGVNYFDTAYVYPRSEERLGRILAKNQLRDKVLLADKLPPYQVKKPEDAERMLCTQLKRLQTDHIDYYLIHMLPNITEWERLLNLSLADWIAQKKASGQIVNLGFSYHGGLQEFKTLIDAYDWDFCMLQYNYYDENNQAGLSGLNYAVEKGLPVMVMEPLRGGKLAGKLPAAARHVWENASPQRTSAEWGLRWVWNNPHVLTVLSGMNSLEMVEENIQVAEDALPAVLTTSELALYEEVRGILGTMTKVPCTGCNYCMPCPQGVDIPMCFDCYNESSDSKVMAQFYYVFRTHNHVASLCRQCGLCEKHCPQHIPVADKLKEVAQHMERPIVKPLAFLIKRFMRLS